MGSCFELDPQCEVVTDIYTGFEEPVKELQEILNEECRMIQGFINKNKNF